MEISKKFNTLTFQEYFFYIDNHKKYTDFNALGLYRSIIEHENLTTEEKIAISNHAHSHFQKSFDFLQLKDPAVFFDITTLGQELTKADENQIWENIFVAQQKILKDKKIKHRNFGDYAKHNCHHPGCPLDGLMIRQGSLFAEREMKFHTDKRTYTTKVKAQARKIDRKNKKQIIDSSLKE